jgi:hypothetical protein
MRFGGAQLDVSLLEDWPSENGCFIQDPVNTSRVKDCVSTLNFPERLFDMWDKDISRRR